MPRPSRLSLAEKEIAELLSGASQKIYSDAQLAKLLDENRTNWKLSDRTRVTDFISFLKRRELKEHEIRSDNYSRQVKRYSWGKPSPLALAVSIKPRAHLCHATAAAIHGLGSFSRATIYINAEQSPKRLSRGSLTREGINRAFSAKQRQSNLVYTYNRTSIVIIAGKNTNCFGVEEIIGPDAETIRVTNLERTLIDIVVRPAYAGGTSQLLKAYRFAKNRISIDRLLNILKTLDYAYPYHQSIGFLMQRAGYSESATARLRALGLKHDFYLAHGIHEPEYSEKWRLFYPRHIK